MKLIRNKKEARKNNKKPNQLTNNTFFISVARGYCKKNFGHKCRA